MIRLLLLPLILSEILANEPGSTVSLEWIELEARQTAQLSHYKLVANRDTVILPGQTIDSGRFIVICRDTLRFESHYGDSSGIWGDHPIEQYPLLQSNFSLPNTSGTVALADSAQFDSFTWDRATPDATSFERVDDTLWQTTDPLAIATPGTRNYGAPTPFDWAIVEAAITPAIPSPDDPVTLQITVANTGASASSTTLRIAEPSSGLERDVSLNGPAGFTGTLAIDFTPAHGTNTVTLTLAFDDRLQNNTQSIRFIAAAPPLIITEIYAVPDAAEPEWLELFVRADTAIALDSLQLADTRDTASLADLHGPIDPGTYFILTENIAALHARYPDFTGIALQPPDWPALNNTGDTITLLQNGIPFTRTGYPSFGTRRGVSLERIGSSDTWGFSASPDHATPGSVNSIDVPYTSGIEIAIAPNPFASGEGEQATIHYTVPFAAEGELRLYSGDGRHLRTLLPHAPIVSGETVWDGRGPDGHLLPVGIYLVYLKLTEPAERSQLATVVIAR